MIEPFDGSRQTRHVAEPARLEPRDDGAFGPEPRDDAAAERLPRWDGSDPSGMTILARCPADLGESIRFARYLPLLTGRRAAVVLTCPPALRRLFERLPGLRVASDGGPLPHADGQVSLADLPRLFGTTPATIPTFASYLRAPAGLTAAWRQLLRPRRAGLRPYLVGTACGGDGGGVVLPGAADVSTLPAVAGVQFVRMGRCWVNLGSATSVLGGASALYSPGAGPGTVHALHDLADTAAVLAQLDLVITADPVVAHLAGAAGKAVWTLVPCAGAGARAGDCWPDAGQDTPWYPTMRLFEQAAPGDWSDVLAAIVLALRAAPARGEAIAA